MRAAPALLVLLLLLPLAPAATPIVEDDAGSGQDAPDSVEAARARPLVVATGTLHTGYTDWVLDTMDVYAFHAEAGQRILVDAAGPLGCVRLYRPDGAWDGREACNAAYARLETLALDADVSGLWFVSYDYLEPQVYRFSIGLDVPGPSPYLAPEALAAGTTSSLPALAPGSPAAEHVVVAVVDTGINPYHRFFAAPELSAHASTWLSGFPADAESVALSLAAPTYADAVAADAATWDALRRGSLYTFPGTRVVGAISFSEYDDPLEPGVGARAILDEHGHGTKSAGLALGAGLDAAEADVLVVMVEAGVQDFARGVAWAARQPWIDAISLSTGSRANLPATPEMLEAIRLARVAQKPLLVASGNGVSGTGLAPDHCSTHTSHYTGPSWVVRIGAAEPASGSPSYWHCVPVDATAATNVPAPSHASRDTAALATGTSAATPNAMGAFAHLLLRARDRALPTQAPPTVLAHLLNASAPPPPALGAGSEPSVRPIAFADQGYGLVDARALERAWERLLVGAAPTPRPELDAWWAADRALREALWGDDGVLSTGAVQDDAGTGRDAPNILSDGARIAPGVAYQGLLLGTATDGDDAYAFDVDAGDVIHARSRGNVHCATLHDPAGTQRALACSTTTASPAEIAFVADAPGTWYLLVGGLQPERYSFGVGLDAPAPRLSVP